MYASTADIIIGENVSNMKYITSMVCLDRMWFNLLLWNATAEISGDFDMICRVNSLIFLPQRLWGVAQM